jgi:hypothetical protein
VNVLEWLANSSYALWVNQSWGWPLALTIHAFGTATVFGLMFIITSRLFGLFPTIPYSAMNNLIPYIWFAIICQVVSGFTLWMTKPAQYLADGMFEVKFMLVIVASVVTWFFQRILKEEATKWDSAGAVSVRGLKYSGITCLLWAGVVIGGRLTAYLGSLYLG